MITIIHGSLPQSVDLLVLDSHLDSYVLNVRSNCGVRNFQKWGIKIQYIMHNQELNTDKSITNEKIIFFIIPNFKCQLIQTRFCILKTFIITSLWMVSQTSLFTYKTKLSFIHWSPIPFHNKHFMIFYIKIPSQYWSCCNR